MWCGCIARSVFRISRKVRFRQCPQHAPGSSSVAGCKPAPGPGGVEGTARSGDRPDSSGQLRSRASNEGKYKRRPETEQLARQRRINDNRGRQCLRCCQRDCRYCSQNPLVLTMGSGQNQNTTYRRIMANIGKEVSKSELPRSRAAGHQNR